VYLAALLPAERASASVPPGGREGETPANAVAEAAMLALRTSRGIPATLLDDGEIGRGLVWALGAELVEHTHERLILTRRGRLLSNEVFARLL
jgi:coproporphyrinogen III oxidase-like Fe-S oxidoreductase